MAMHRPLHPNTYVTDVRICKKRIGDEQYRWEAVFTCVLPRKCGSFRPAHQPTGKELAINLGFRSTDMGLRVAYGVDSDGHKFSVLIPWDRVKALWQYPNTLASIRSNFFNQTRAKLLGFLESAELPDWLKTESRFLKDDKVRSRRLRRLILNWRENRFKGDEEIYKVLEHTLEELKEIASTIHQYSAFRNQDKHLEDWQNGLRRRAENWRKDLYRKLAREWSMTYDRLLICEIDWAKMKRNALPEMDADPVVKDYWNASAPGLFDAILGDYFAGRIVQLDPDLKTARCHVCGELCDVDGRKVEHKCEHCPATWDIDFNHCKNLFKVHLQTVGS
jgi:hypothetical protein